MTKTGKNRKSSAKFEWFEKLNTFEYFFARVLGLNLLSVLLFIKKLFGISVIFENRAFFLPAA